MACWHPSAPAIRIATARTRHHHDRAAKPHVGHGCDAVLHRAGGLVLVLRRDRPCQRRIVGWHVAHRGDRWAALESIHQGVRRAFGAFGKDIARGLAIRSDWGPQYVADAFRSELAWLGITHS